MKFCRFTAKSVERIFKKMQDQDCLSVRQQKQLLGCWKLAASRSSKGSLVTILIENFVKRCLGRRIFRAWQKGTASFLERESSLFKNKACFLVGQGMFHSWAIYVETLVIKRKQLLKSTLQLAALRALKSWSLIVFWNKQITSFASRRQHSRIKKWRSLVAIRQRFSAQDAFIRTILSKRYELTVGRFVFRLWVESTKVNLARSKRQLAAIQQNINRNQKRLQGAFMIWIRVKTTGFGVKRIVSERLRKLFFRWHTFVEYRRSKSLLKSKLQQQASPPSNAR